jgi:hypothetical protein
MPSDRVVCVDLDGVLNVFDQWTDASRLHAMRPGAREFLSQLHSSGYQIVIHTVRWAPQVWEWLRENELAAFVSAVTDKKVPAHVYIDDRAVCFHGDFDQTLDAVKSFSAHWQNTSVRE